MISKVVVKIGVGDSFEVIARGEVCSEGGIYGAWLLTKVRGQFRGGVL